MARSKIIAGNWKMHTDAAAAASLAAAVAAGAGHAPAKIVLCPPFPFLAAVVAAVKGSGVNVGGQNLHPEPQGAFTGEVSAAMLKSVGCDYVLAGHSERRQLFGESDDFINKKVKAGLAAGLCVILCVGETLEERQSDNMHKVLDRHVTEGLAGVAASDLPNVILAYEPVWAIGTGVVASPDQAQEAHLFLRHRLVALFGQAAADGLTIQYGGSVKPDNARDILSQPDVDGALVGGASLKADGFLAIVAAAG